jgi:DNA (cytosine-5)-methyltransferase 1
MAMNEKYTVGSMFAGIGGICLAFKNAGFKVVWANEIDKYACITYRANFNDTSLKEEDVLRISNLEEIGEVDVITSGFPCQAFSIAGYRKGFSDERGNLFFETARFIDELRPKAYLLENVKNLVGHDKGRTFRIIKETMTKELGYSFIPFVLDSKDYGNIPQTRERIYVVGFKNEAGYENYREHTLKWSPEPDCEKSCTLNFTIPKPIKRTKTIHDLLLKGKQEDKYYYKENHPYYQILQREIKSEDTIYQWRRIYLRENKSSVCPTLTANMGTGGHNVPLIKDSYGIRKLTPRECARFQGFPDTFVLPKNVAQSQLYKQLGNSVVVSVVRRIAEEIANALIIKYKAHVSNS